MVAIPAQFATTIHEVYGPRGADWLARLPELVSACGRRWQVRLGKPLRNLTYNFVLPVTGQDGSEYVLKLGVPSDEMSCELTALRHFDGRGAARLIDADPTIAALLIERISPGTPPTLSRNAAGTLIAASVMKQLWQPPPAEHSFPSVKDWGNGFSRLRTRFDGGTGPLPARLVERAEETFAKLLATSGRQVVLHGDLHHGNMLFCARRDDWVAIDPKGVIGEAPYDTGAWMRNPPGVHEWPGLDEVLVERLDYLNEVLGFRRQRMRDWAFAQAVLSAIWSIEDHGHGWEPAIILAEHFSTLKV